ncbi:MFS transporter [Bacillus paranthracis]|uniref:MFS transporter n=1 Tax=Bacillus paranthracis TaxID=2026186 RepID=UPI00298D1643|nr:MFS transporter [Bacillus paranthracis]
MNKSMFEPLKSKNFRKFYAAQIISDLGGWFDFTALLVLFAYHWNLGPGALASLTIAIGLPGLLFGSITGVFVDKLPLKLVMITSDILRAIVVFCLIFAPNFYFVLVLVFIKGVFTTFFDPARQSSIKCLVPPEQLLKANSLSQLSVNGSKIIGPALGSLILVIATPQVAFVIDSISFILSALLLWTLPKINRENEERIEETGVFSGFWKDFREGFAFIWSKKNLTILILFNATVFFIIFLFDSLGVLLAKEMGIRDNLFGIFISVVGIGAVVGAITVGQWGTGVNKMKILNGSAVLLGGMLILTGLGGFGLLPSNLVLWFLIWFFVGVCLAAISVCYGYLIQSETPSRLMGRVSSTANAMVNGAMVISPTLGSILALWIEVSGVFLFSGILIASIGTIVYLSNKYFGKDSSTVFQSENSVFYEESKKYQKSID